MAEYDCGVLFGSRSSSKLSNSTQFPASNLSQMLYLPSDFDIGPPLLHSKLRLSQNIDKDILLLAEFSEIEGPIPLLSIPEQFNGAIDINDFVLKLMSTDYQNMCGEFRIAKDTCLLQEDAMVGHYFYVHYFTLYDVKARGFVRPMCLVYLSREPQKLRKYIKFFQKEFTQVTEYMKVSNLEQFKTEIKIRIEDLEFTKQRFIQINHHFPKDDIQNMQVQNDCLLDKCSFKLKRKRFYTAAGREPSNALAASGKPEPDDLDLLFTNNSDNHIKGTPGNHCLPFLYTTPQMHSSSPSEPSTLSNQIRSEFKPDFLKSMSPSSKSKHERVMFGGSPKDGVFETSLSSDSSSSTIKSFKAPSTMYLSSLMLSESPSQRMSESDEASILQHTSVDALNCQLQDCQNILGMVQDYLETSNTRTKLKEFLDEVVLKPYSPLYAAVQELGLITCEDPDKSQAPSIFVAALMHHNYRNMRKVKKLCGIGYAAALIILFQLYEKYSKSILSLHFEDLDRHILRDPYSSLFLGNIPIINFGCSSSEAQTPKECHLIDFCWSKEIAHLLLLDFPNVSTPESEYADALDSFDVTDVTVADDCLEVFTNEAASSSTEDESTGSDNENAAGFPIKSNDQRQPSTPHRSTSSDGSWSSSLAIRELEMFNRDLEEEGEEELVLPLESDERIRIRYHDIDDRLEKSKLYHLSAVIQQFSGVSQCIVFSILSGKPVIVAGPESLKPVVVLYVNALSTILPCKPNQMLPLLKWHTGTITNHHIRLYRLMGVCIPERLHVHDLMSISTLNQVTVLNIETGHISGVAYSGTLLHKGDQLSRKNFRSNITIQAALQNLLLNIGRKTFLLHHLMNTTSGTSNEILKGIGISRGDWNVIQYLASLVNEQMEQSC